MSNIAPDAPADSRLMAAFITALEIGETRTKLDTPAFAQKKHTLAEILADEAGGDRAEVVIGCLLRTFARALKSKAVDDRLHAMSEAATLARIFADTHSEAAALADADADDNLRADHEAFDRAAAFAGACFPALRRGAA